MDDLAASLKPVKPDACLGLMGLGAQDLSVASLVIERLAAS